MLATCYRDRLLHGIIFRGSTAANHVVKIFPEIGINCAFERYQWLEHVPLVLNRLSWPGLSTQVEYTRLASDQSADLGQARGPMPSTSCGTDVDARVKPAHDGA
jgi:hypothetical protein